MSYAVTLEFLLLAALWGASFLLTRLGVAEFGTLPATGLRVALAAIFLSPVFLIKNVWTDFRKNVRPVLFVGILNSAIPFALFAFAVMHISTGLTSILNATVPLSGALVSWVWLKHGLDKFRIVGLITGFIGVALLIAGQANINIWNTNAPSNASTFIAIGACLLATLCYGIAASFAKRYLSGVHPLATAAGSQMGAALCLCAPMVWLWPAQPIGVQAWLAVGASALFCTALAYVLFFRIIDKAGPTQALAVTFLIPVFALFYGYCFLNETIGLWTVICGLIILAGTALSTGLLRLR